MEQKSIQERTAREIETLQLHIGYKEKDLKELRDDRKKEHETFL